MKFNDIPKFTKSASYHVTVDWRFLEEHLKHWSQEENNDLGPESGVNLDPDFQRAHVWTEKQQRMYVEYILRGGVSGRDLFFNCVGWGNTYKGPFVLVDGKQRLEAVRKFLRNELCIFPSYEGGNCIHAGYLFSDFSDRLPFQASFEFWVNDLKHKHEWLKWYLEMNTGGTVHTDAEIEKVKDMLRRECHRTNVSSLLNE